ncbi:Crp/Fnr family transcriptional regulator [Granulicella tundricola]|uniref:Putative transcriptional regulator, Crp/Fnr family n=1 Tax=Granulicella tundricola (strain ATCC BAA-1859 / DSM 23138 / MP5ACTX9) TaxID=1198114 RepID=E8X766_GRATM|nr:Crp/Fnr family transcriptional regulator [Granulicella tundricola]ADW71300.1 putative transcriptional regulator, Crp/Fnr family [Granulicella tundricola MP5ACTX9]
MAAPRTNLLLEALSPESRKRLIDLSKAVDLPIRTPLQAQDEQPKHAYIMLSGIASVVVNLPEGGSAEVAVIGREGITSCISLLGPSAPPSECFMQVAGSGYKILFADLKAAFLDSEEIRTRILELAQQQTLTMSQIAACNKLHDNEARLSRWLLMVQDRLQEDLLPLTQEFLAEMLGSRRTTVAVSAGTLQRAGMIEYRRGKVTSLSRENLEAAACDCYKVSQRLFQALYKTQE